MRKYIFFLLMAVGMVTAVAQKKNTLTFSVDAAERNINISLIDSITYSYDEGKLYQYVWHEGKNIAYPVKSDDNIGFGFVDESEYRLYDKSVDGIDALITSRGDYCAIIDTGDTYGNRCAVLGNRNFPNKDYAVIDSVGLVREVVSDDNVYSFLYATDCMVVLCNGTWLRNIAYKDLSVSESTQVQETEIKSPVFRYLNLISQIRTYLEMPVGQTIINLTQAQYKGNANNKLDFIDDVVEEMELSERLKRLDEVIDKYCFADASITTVTPLRKSMCRYMLACEYSEATVDMPYLKCCSQYGIPCSFKIIADLRGNHNVEEPLRQNVVPEKSGKYSFGFSELDLQTEYTYEPMLEVCIEFPSESFCCSVDKDRDKPVIYRRYKHGEPSVFDIGNVECSIDDLKDVTEKSAKIECTYGNVPEGAVCGVKVTNVATKEELRLPNGDTDGTRVVEASDLKPCTEYTYVGYVTYKGVDYTSGDEGRFTTLPPDISGEWICKEKHYKFGNINLPYYTTYTVELHKDGTMTCSDISGGISSSWSLQSDGTIAFEIVDIATQTSGSGKKWKGKVDNMYNPQKMTGYTNRWNYNQSGFFNGESYEFELTR